MAEMHADSQPARISEPSYANREAMRVAGLSEDFTRERIGEIPKLWDRFNAELARLNDTAQWTRSTYGIVYPRAEMHYVAAVELKRGETVPEGWEIAELPAQHYAVFAESGGLAAIPPAWTAIWGEWLPRTGRKVAAGPMLERYPADWVTSGKFEIWVPLEQRGL